MFRAKTLFILGAGSSHEVGLPIGETLKTKIAKNLNILFPDGIRQSSGHFGITQALRQLVATKTTTSLSDGKFIDVNTYINSAWALRDALPLSISIDNLLDAHRGDKIAEACGKLGIVSSILEAEKTSQLYFDSSQGNSFNLTSVRDTWFAGFLKLIIENRSKKEIDDLFSNVSIINFNYDRCLEHYLNHAIKFYYNISNEDAQRLVNKLKVHRPYGVVGKLNWQTGNLLNVSYGQERNDLVSLHQGIRTFNEQINDEEMLHEIKKTVQEADVIIFLGFAFHRQNLQLLKPKEGSSKVKYILGTAYGMSDSDCIVVKKELKDIMKLHKSTPIDLRRDLTCAKLLAEFGRALTASLE